MSDSGKKGKQGEPGEGEELPEIEVDLEEAPEEPKEDPDLCVAVDDLGPNCAGCEHFPRCTHPAKSDPFQLTREPVSAVSQVAVDGTQLFTTEELAKILGQMNSSADHRKVIDRFKAVIIHYIDRNPTKGLDICTAAVIYLQMLIMPSGVLAIHVIQLFADCITAFLELREETIYSQTTTPIGVKPN